PPPPVALGRRLGKPHGIAIGQSERREKAGEAVSRKSDVKIAQPPAPGYDQSSQQQRRNQAVEHCFQIDLASKANRNHCALFSIAWARSRPASTARGKRMLFSL